MAHQQGAIATEHLVLVRCLSGEKKAWGELYYGNEAGLRGVIRRKLGPQARDRELAEDMLSRVWCKLVDCDYAVLLAFDPARCRLSGYLAEQARRVVRDYRRDRKRQLAREVPLPANLAGDRSAVLDCLAAGREELLQILTPGEKQFLEGNLLANSLAPPARVYKPATIKKMKQRILRAARALFARD